MHLPGGSAVTEDDLPQFFVYGRRPVKIIRTPEGRMAVLAYEWDTGEFVQDFRYYSRIFYGKHDDARQVLEDDFNRYVAELRAGDKGHHDARQVSEDDDFNRYVAELQAKYDVPDGHV
jgi:hypothetical protein